VVFFEVFKQKNQLPYKFKKMFVMIRSRKEMKTSLRAAAWIFAVSTMSLTPIFGQNETASTNTSVAMDPIRPVEPMNYPTFQGGSIGLYQHLTRQFKYPNSAWKKQLEGVVRVRFVVNYDGTVQDVEILKGLSLDIDEEIVRIFTILPRWKPATQNGKRVKATFSFDFPVEVPNTPAGAMVKPEPVMLVRSF
jgi:TonB family protein